MDWIAASLELIGIALVGLKYRVGFLVLILCSIAWITYVARSGAAYGLVMVTVPLIVVNALNFRRWGRDE